MKLNIILDSVCLLYCVNVKALQSKHRLNMARQCMQFSQPAKKKKRNDINIREKKEK